MKKNIQAGGDNSQNQQQWAEGEGSKSRQNVYFECPLDLRHLILAIPIDKTLSQWKFVSPSESACPKSP